MRNVRTSASLGHAHRNSFRLSRAWCHGALANLLDCKAAGGRFPKIRRPRAEDRRAPEISMRGGPISKFGVRNSGMLAAPVSQPPTHLSPSAANWWRSVVETYILQEHHLRLLQLACEAWDEVQKAREQ